MKLGIVGLPDVGKSTLFNSSIRAGAESADYLFCTTNPNVGIVPTPGVKLDKLTEMYNSEKTTPTVIEFVGIMGLVRGASKDKELGNQFLSNTREVDAIVHAVRCFDDLSAIHVDGGVDPLKDIEITSLELISSDIETPEHHIVKQSKGSFNSKDLAKEVELLKAMRAHLKEGKLARGYNIEDGDEREFIDTLSLLTWKPVIFTTNVTESGLANGGTDNAYIQSVCGFATENGCEVFVVCAEIEQEIAELGDDEKKTLLDDLGLAESDLEKLIATNYRILGLMSYLTTDPQEGRARTIKTGTKAPQAVGKTHNDFERGFIRAEAVSYDDLMNYGSMNVAKEKSLVHFEDEKYVMRDGDVVLLHFNV